MIKHILTILLIFLAFNLNATNYYISTTGNNANNGLTSGTAKATLANIFSSFNLAANDTVFVLAGTYTETGITVGTNDEGFIIYGVPYSYPSGSPTSIFDATSTSRWLLLNNTNNDNITIQNLTIKDYKNSDGGSPGGGGAIKVIAGCIGLTINYCIFNNCDTRTASLNHRGGAIYSAEAITVKYSSFYNCDSEYHGGAISVELSPAGNSSISYCKFYSNNCSNYGGAIYYDITTSKSLTLTNCLFYENNNTNGHAVIVCTGSTSIMNIINCTITKNGNVSNGTGGVLALASGKIYLTNTIVYSNIGTTYNDIYNNTSTITLTNCCYGSASEINSINTNTSPLVANPSFTDATNDDYTLSSSSSCKNVGTSTGAPSDDILTYLRDGLIDIGAYEYGAIPLPIELLYFSGVRYNENNFIYWSTASEYINDYYEIEKSSDGLDFRTISIINGCGSCSYTNKYNIIDYNVDNIINYYRMKQVDMDGKYVYYDIISIDNRNNGYIEYKTYNLLGQEIDEKKSTGVILYKYSNGNTIMLMK